KAKSWDLTKDRIFTLSDQTIGVLKGLKDPVTVQAFFSGSEPEYVELDSRLRQYKAQTDKLSVEFVDPFKHPGRVKDMNISQSGPRVIVKSGNKESRAKEISEEALTNALIEVSRGSTKKIYFTKGHGEHAVADNTERGIKLFVDNLKGEGYQTDEIVLAEHKEMPADAQALVVAGPVAAFTDGEAKLVKDWVEKGGKLVVMVDPRTQSGLEGAFESWGIHVGKDEVIDPEAQNPEVAIAQTYAEHPITQPRSSPFALATIFPVARSVSKAAAAPSTWTVTELAKTGPRAWGETGSPSIWAPAGGSSRAWSPGRPARAGERAMKQTTKTLVGLLALLLVAGGIAGVALWAGKDEQKKAEAKEKSEKLFDFDKAHAHELRLSKDGRPVARLVKGEKSWKLVQPVEAEADDTTVDSLLSSLSGLKQKKDLPDEKDL